jgi:hypothetical protein
LGVEALQPLKRGKTRILLKKDKRAFTGGVWGNFPHIPRGGDEQPSPRHPRKEGVAIVYDKIKGMASTKERINPHEHPL